jgi:hypothetical protein
MIGARHPETMPRPKRWLHDEAKHLPCQEIDCRGQLIEFTHGVYPLARCDVCGRDYVIDKPRQGGKYWSARPVHA